MWICQKISTFKIAIALSVMMIWKLMLPYWGEASEYMEMAGAVESERVEKHVVILLVPGLSFNEVNWLYECGKYREIWHSGAVSAMNVKPDGPYSYLNNIVSLSVGKRSSGIEGWNSFAPDENIDGVPVDNLFFQWHGISPASSIVHPHVHILQDKLSRSSYQATAGWLGESLKHLGVHRFVLGNADLRSENIRYGSLFIMDGDGSVEGNLHGPVVDNAGYPGGKKMDADTIYQQVNDIHNAFPQTFTVVEWGDLFRLYSERYHMTKDHFARMYETILFDLEDTVHRLHGTKAEVWLLSPVVNAEAHKEKNQLAPLWIWKENRATTGVLYSDTTRRYTVISNTDITATWLAMFAGTQALNKGIGRALHLQHADQGAVPFPEIQAAVAEMNDVFVHRGAVLSSYVSALVAMLILVSLLIWLLVETSRWKSIACTLLLSGILSPWWFLVTSPWGTYFSPYLYVAVILAGSCITAYFLGRAVKEPFSFACFLFFITLLLDVAGGSNLTQRSFLSYDPIIGARYYGIGNEFAGIVLVSGILMVAPVFRRIHGDGRGNYVLQWLLMTLVMLVLVLLLGMSVLGANAGASLSAGIVYAFITSRLLFNNIPFWVKAISGSAVFVVLLTVLYLLQMAQPESHIFAAFQQLFSGEWTAIWQTMVRKISMNWKIFKISYWTQLFITSYFFIGIVLWKRRRSRLMETENFLINGCIAGSLALLLLNDSGIVAAATSMFMTLCVCYGWSLRKASGT
ncbi:hypothetical protein SAMN05421736_1158 [Evansella caseinilytica]|uniref:Uncharacterized protein n=1 Tax=Evansella caseinilytica TaxID=1503961 RepID=A0A1H3TJ40_9BACI|nr:hypothetical protein [Evansella caseinilytica]SDZ50342.1 hypothetical protein SAMN05421736_1158 [Evansella caseinilytica]